MSFLSRIFRKPDHSAFITPLIVSVVFGAAAGAVGTLLVVAATPPPELVTSTVVQQVVSHRAAEDGRMDAADAEPAARSFALLVRARAAGAGLLDRAAVPADAIGAAMVLTSDGWLLSTEAAVTPAVRAALGSYRVVIGTDAYPIRSAAVDSFTGIVFLKVDATNLPVTAFASGVDLAPGASVMTFDLTGAPRHADVVGYGVRAASVTDLVRSSERTQNTLRLSRVDEAVPSGSMVVNASGEAVAILVGNDAYGAMAVPFGAFRGQISAILRDGRTNRPLLGVRYADLAHLLGFGDGSGSSRPRGALLAPASNGAPAVMRGGPAERAGLVSGDIILAVNGEELGSRTALADVVAEYTVGSVITLTVRRANGIDANIPVTLSAAP